MTVIHVDFRPRTVIVTKRKTYILAPGAVGIPVEERLETVPACMKGMKFWQAEDGEVKASAEVEQTSPD